MTKSTHGVLLEVHPLQQMAGHEVLESGRVGWHDRPVEVIVLLLLLDRTEPRRPERRHAKDGIEPFECRDPGGSRLVADLEVLAQAVDRQRRSDEIGKAKHQEFEVPQILDALERRDVVANEAGPILARPAAGFDEAPPQKGLGKSAQRQ
jgi:hypothetical protein